MSHLSGNAVRMDRARRPIARSQFYNDDGGPNSLPYKVVRIYGSNPSSGAPEPDPVDEVMMLEKQGFADTSRDDRNFLERLDHQVLTFLSLVRSTFSVPESRWALLVFVAAVCFSAGLGAYAAHTSYVH